VLTPWENVEMKKVLGVISSSDSGASCQAYRVDEIFPDEATPQDENALYGYNLISGPVIVKGDVRKKLSSIIEDPATYLPNAIPTDCFFRPGVAFRFKDKKARVDLFVCFVCNELRYYLDGEIISQFYFKPQKIVSLVKELFPEDAGIQKL
jgi:hypothetical protein